MPATGVRPPLLILVIVRAMAPVAGMPPNSGVSRLAAPCAISSVFESWRSPVTPSATVAEQGFDSPQQRNGQSHGEQAAHHLPIHRGHGCGRQFGTDRKAVADGIDALHARIRSKRPNPGRQHDDGHQRPRDTAREPGCKDNQQDAAHPHGQVRPVDRTEMAEIEHPLADEIPGTGSPPKFIPNRSAICVVKIVRAMPAVNPTTTG